MIGMGIQIIQDDINAVRVRVEGIDQIAHGIGEILFGAAARHQDVTFSGFGFSQHKHIAGAIALILMVLSTRVPRLHWNGSAGVLEQLDILLIKTNHGTLRVIRQMIQSQDAFHLCQEHARYLSDTPAFDLPGFNLFFFRVKRTVSGAICSITPSSIRRWASSSRVQRARPLGGSLHANAVRCASCPSSSLALPPRPGLSTKALSSPSSQNRKRVRRTVSSSMYSWSQISRSVRPSSLFSKMCARRITTAWLRPLLTIANTFCRSFSVSFILCFIILSAYLYPSALAS